MLGKKYKLFSQMVVRWRFTMLQSIKNHLKNTSKWCGENSQTQSMFLSQVSKDIYHYSITHNCFTKFRISRDPKYHPKTDGSIIQSSCVARISGEWRHTHIHGPAELPPLEIQAYYCRVHGCEVLVRKYVGSRNWWYISNILLVVYNPLDKSR